MSDESKLDEPVDDASFASAVNSFAEIVRGIANSNWKKACTDDYKELSRDAGWEDCPQCGQYPRVREADDHWYAKCWCSKGPMDQAQASAPAAWTAYQNNEPWCSDNLRVNWNKRCADILQDPEFIAEQEELFRATDDGLYNHE